MAVMHASAYTFIKCYLAIVTHSTSIFLILIAVELISIRVGYARMVMSSTAYGNALTYYAHVTIDKKCLMKA